MADKPVYEVYDRLKKVYGSQGWWPIVNSDTLVSESRGDAPRNEEEQFEIAVGAILTQNTSWKNVEKALVEMKKAKVLSRKSVSSIPEDRLISLIRSAGYYNQKCKKLKKFTEFKGDMTKSDLLSIWGIGSETADSILLYAYNLPVFVVDAYTKRIFSRLGLVKEDVNYDELQDLFHSSLKKDSKLFNEYHALLVEHAKRHCKTMPVCENCPIGDICRSFKKQ